MGIIVVAFQLTTSAYGINPKRLEFEADTYQHRIWSRVPSEVKMIKESLSFLSDDDKFDKKYAQPEGFLKFYKEVNDEIKDESFLRFSAECRKIFEGSENDRNKVAVYMLLEKVSEKSLKYLRSLKKLEKFKSQYEDKLKETDTNSSLEYFLNIDKVVAFN
ncbi:MAG: hypothetical protein ACP5OE_06280 [Thermodesulfobium sp.]